MKPPALFVLVLLVPVVAGAELYRWVDPQGRVHYTEVPPKHGSYETVRGAPPPQSSPNLEALQQMQSEEAAQDAKRRTEAAESQRAAQAAEQRRKNCERARAQLSAIDAAAGRRLFTRDSAGQTQYMPEEKVQAERARMEEIVRQSC